MSGTVVFVHAHPDDEALLTGGTIALLAASGRRVVLVTATDGAEGLASEDVASGSTLARIRSEELAEAAASLGVARSVQLGYPDSGLDGDADCSAIDGAEFPFARTPVSEVADRLVAILREERASVVVGYDRNGGYRHPDHLQVHRVTKRAARIAGTPVYLEATLPREPLVWAVSIAYRVRWLVPQLGGLDPEVWRNSFTPRSEITDAVDVRPFVAVKRAALRAHSSQVTADEGLRTIDVLLRLPDFVFARLMGTEWYVRAAQGAPAVGVGGSPLNIDGPS
ncbi:MAG: PIG-L family deacetylase [Candidatus Nanopelagicales bacterium]|nr:PIG-L family deacetylase [Candidatus Nanopelagicales bacterium]